MIEKRDHSYQRFAQSRRVDCSAIQSKTQSLHSQGSQLKFRAPTASLRQVCLLFVCLALNTMVLAAQTALKLPDGFSVSRAAGPPEVLFPMFAAPGERGELYVAESSGLDLYDELQKLTRRCRISRLEDRDGDGVFERAQVFADKLVFPMGIAWRDSKLYVADPPDLVMLEDTDGDGLADKRTVLLTGFGHTDNGSLHGLTFGPDGWLYLTMGQPDGYQLKRSDGSILSGKSGALLRCRPDGSDIEVVCRGFENLVEIEFMPAGEIIGTDNWFSLPEGGERDALVHLLEGGLYPLNAHARTEARLFNSGELLPPVSIYPAVALSGLVRYRGDAFPARFQGALFSAQFNARKVAAHHLKRHGSTFRSEDEAFLTTEDPDFHPSDVLEDADGSLLVVDTGAWYVHHCPTGRIRKAPAQGGIYRVRFDKAGDTSKAKSKFQDPSSKPQTDQSLLTSATTDPDTAARIARAFGRSGDNGTEKALLGLLSRPEPHVRLAAAEALTHCGSTNAVPALIAALTSDIDRFLEHALVYALHRLADQNSLTVALDHLHPRVQRAALLLLDQSPHQKITADAVLKRLLVEDAPLRRAALMILQKHPDWSVHAEPVVRDLIHTPVLNKPAGESLQELVLAFQTNPAMQSLIASAATNTSLHSSRREFLLQTMARTTFSPLPVTWISALEMALRESEPSIRLQAARTAGTRKIAALDEPLMQLIAQTNLSGEVRLEALRATLGRHPKLTPAAFDLLLDQIGPQSSFGSRLASVELLSRAQWADSVKDPQRLLSVVQSDRLVSPSTLLPLLVQGEGDGFPAAWGYLKRAISDGWQPGEQELQTIATRVPRAAAEEFEALKRQVTKRAANQREQIDSYAELLAGGDPVRGERWFVEKTACAACHRVGGRGGLVGPDLTKIGAIRADRDLIEALVLPSMTFAQGYDTFSVTLRDGENLRGIRVRQPDEAFVLRDASGAETRLHADQIQNVERSKVSIMPEGLLGTLAREEIRDLLAYLQSLK
ncbi:MAG: c-type cytochrome [Pedosphaera sp.]|nr:c-type cytochrome [Pedosphaera sp.]